MCNDMNKSFFSYPPSSGISSCVGTVGTVHMTPTLDAALLYVVFRDGVTTTSSRADFSMNVQPCSLHTQAAGPLSELTIVNGYGTMPQAGFDPPK